MERVIKIKKGLDIPLDGAAVGASVSDTQTSLYGIVPDDYPGYIWKARVKPGDKVKAGDKLMSDKETDSVWLVSPVDGEVAEIRRGARRHIEAIVVKREGGFVADKETTLTDAVSIRTALKESGLWAMMRQRPFDIVPAPDSEPRDIYVTAFDSAPLAGPVITPRLSKWLEKGLEILKHLTSGNVYLAVRSDSRIRSNVAEILTMEGPHPAGNVGVQIANTNPVNKGETVWTLDAATVCRIGLLASEGKCDYTVEVAVTGPAIRNPHFVECGMGISMEGLLRPFEPITGNHLRYISGNVLTGKRVNLKEGFLRWPYRQVTVIEEGDTADEFMGWASMNPKKYSVKRSFPAFLRGLSSPFPFDARIKGGRRAMILSGEYDKVFPFDIYPEYLLKAIIAGDIDRMEQLGIYEVAPEDFALPEFVDTSKMELQKIVREGLDSLRKELS
ncbi:MAG: Na(+)-translocating NADH-quinone reductase subunit A [Bacteroidales bacterium]|nr:Na(+)-translocating NADH-quinone reductase subunit A [Bacteroidales bacterium]